MALVAATLVIDQLSKQLLLGYLLKVGNVVPVIDDFFRLVIVWNRGVSFGLLGGDRALPAWLLSGVAIAVCIGLFLWLRRTDRPFTGWGIGLVMGGAIGNVIDRARWGAVFDFADFHVGELALAGVQCRRCRDRRRGRADAHRFADRREAARALIRP